MLRRAVAYKPILQQRNDVVGWFQKEANNNQQQQQQQQQQQHQPSTPKPISTPHAQPGLPQLQKLEIHGIKDIICVASGKGGVGKSTVATNLAISLSKLNKRVGLLDADIYGPSIHRMMNIREKPPLNEKRFFIPKSNYGIKVMSMGMLVEEDAPTIWRGPMVMGALEQLFRQTDWGELDVLVVDLPPGTGDAQLTISQRMPVTGAVIVSTPQDIALIDVKRGVNMFKRVHVPILGVIENMSYYQCSNCGHVDHLFGHAGAKQTAEEMHLDFLGEIPLHKEIRTTSDEGTPISILNEQSNSSRAFYSIAQKLDEKLQNKQESKKVEIIMEE